LSLITSSPKLLWELLHVIAYSHPIVI
jgi:hypothetical protein